MNNTQPQPTPPPRPAFQLTRIIEMLDRQAERQRQTPTQPQANGRHNERSQ
jgi:hypothetical protein